MPLRAGSPACSAAGGLAAVASGLEAFSTPGPTPFGAGRFGWGSVPPSGPASPTCGAASPVEGGSLPRSPFAAAQPLKRLQYRHTTSGSPLPPHHHAMPRSRQRRAPLLSPRTPLPAMQHLSAAPLSAPGYAGDRTPPPLSPRGTQYGHHADALSAIQALEHITADIRPAIESALEGYGATLAGLEMHSCDAALIEGLRMELDSVQAQVTHMTHERDQLQDRYDELDDHTCLRRQHRRHRHRRHRMQRVAAGATVAWLDGVKCLDKALSCTSTLSTMSTLSTTGSDAEGDLGLGDLGQERAVMDERPGAEPACGPLQDRDLLGGLHSPAAAEGENLLLQPQQAPAPGTGSSSSRRPSTTAPGGEGQSRGAAREDEQHHGGDGRDAKRSTERYAAAGGGGEGEQGQCALPLEQQQGGGSTAIEAAPNMHSGQLAEQDTPEARGGSPVKELVPAASSAPHSPPRIPEDEHERCRDLLFDILGGLQPPAAPATAAVPPPGTAELPLAVLLRPQQQAVAGPEARALAPSLETVTVAADVAAASASAAAAATAIVTWQDTTGEVGRKAAIGAGYDAGVAVGTNAMLNLAPVGCFSEVLQPTSAAATAMAATAAAAAASGAGMAAAPWTQLARVACGSHGAASDWGSGPASSFAFAKASPASAASSASRSDAGGGGSGSDSQACRRSGPLTPTNTPTRASSEAVTSQSKLQQLLGQQQQQPAGYMAVADATAADTAPCQEQGAMRAIGAVGAGIPAEPRSVALASACEWSSLSRQTDVSVAAVSAAASAASRGGLREALELHNLAIATLMVAGPQACSVAGPRAG